MQFPYPSLRQGLVGAWCPSLGATGYTLIDRSGYGRNGTLTNMDGQQNWQANGSKLALKFDGTNDVVTVPTTAIGLPAAVTASAWVRLSAVTSSFQIVISTDGASGSGGYAIAQNDTGLLYGAIANGYRATPAAATANVWYHCAVSGLALVGQQPLFYVNGALQTGVNAAISSIGASKTLTIGSTGSASYASAWIDDVRVYNRVLTASEIGILASRRGIGLTPLPNTRATYPTRFQICVGGTWREADAYQNVGGTWKAAPPSIKVAGVWK
jgi:hypothetical protein